MIDLQRALRAIAVLATALALSQCGDGGGNDNGADTGSPTPGTFVGTLGDGGSITLQVGSIEAVGFVCDGVEIHESFSPPRSVDADGSFAVEFSDAGRAFSVRGTFSDDDHVTGTIDDKRDRCDTTFAATRGTLPQTPTPVITPTATGPATVTATPIEPPTPPPTTSSPTATPTVTSTGPTDTNTTATPTPTPTGTPSVGPTGSPCPVAVEVISTAGSQKVLDTGFTGIAHEQTVIQDGKLTLTVSDCDSPVRPCGTCTVGGPIPNANADHGDIDAQRCVSDTSTKCSGDPDCGSGKCAFFFGAPLPLSAGGVSTCVTNQVNGNVTGTTNIQSGAFASTLNLTSRVFLGVANAQPCPVCLGDGAVNDGTKGGTCSDGPKKGQPCDGNGRSPIPSFGTTSFDCPPNTGAFVAALSVGLDGSSGTETMTLTANSPKCIIQPGKKCFCQGDQQAGNQPNACIDDTATTEVEGCVANSGSTTKGHCPTGPVDQHCTIETFQGCQNDSECTAPGDTCAAQDRPCYLDNGVVGGSVSAIGMADPPDANGEADPTFAALFCVGKTGRAAIDTVAGLPGLGRVELPLHTKLLPP